MGNEDDVGQFRDPYDYLPTAYNVVGLTSEMFKSTCLISISIHGSVPKRCNCGSTSGSGSSSSSSKKKKKKNEKQQKEIRFDHGVTEHGDTIQTTKEQLQFIQKLT